MAIIAKKADALVLPVAICCKNKITRGEHVTVHFCKPLTLEELGLNKDEVSREEYKAAANTVMKRISLMRESELNDN